MDVLADGTVPSGGGLSSSAAFVCVSVLAVMRANGVEKVDKKELVEVAIVSERAVGVNSGGSRNASLAPISPSEQAAEFKGAGNGPSLQQSAPGTAAASSSSAQASAANSSKVYACL